MPRPKRPLGFARRLTEGAGQHDFPTRRFANVLGSRMAYIQGGTGPDVLFVHGGIASSVIWRRQIGHLSPHARCVAVDLIGTGESSRLLPTSRESYRLEVQLAYLESFVTVLGLQGPLTLVLHGWASMIGFAFAQRHPDMIGGMCHMESIVRPLEWDDLEPRPREVLERAREAGGERFVMDTDEYFDLATRREFLQPPGKAIIDEYRRTLGKAPQLRQAHHTALHSIPIAGEPPASLDFVEQYSSWLRTTTVPKLLVLGEPGYLLTGRVASAAQSLPNTTVVRVSGAHLLPEDAPDGVGLMLSQWVRSL